MNRGIDNPMAKADPDDSPRNTIADALHEEKTIRGYGKRQHGLNGKDADLDSIGQCVVERLYITEDKREGLQLVAELQLYANVCEPRDEENETRDVELRETAEFIVMDFCKYNGEWTGSDYWTFGDSVTVAIPLSDDEYDDGGVTSSVLDAIGARLLAAINATEAVTAFERDIAALNKRLDDLHGSIA